MVNCLRLSIQVDRGGRFLCLNIGCPLDKDTDLNREDPETTEMEIENTHSFDTAVVLNEVEETGHSKGPEYNTHTKLATLTRELDDLHQ